MQASGQYGVPEVPQYGVGRVPSSHSHMFNLSHEMSLSPAPGHEHALSHSPHPQHHHQQQQQPHHHHHLQQQQQLLQHAQHPQNDSQLLPAKPQHDQSQHPQQQQQPQQLNQSSQQQRMVPQHDLGPDLVEVEDHEGLTDEGERGAAANRWPRQETLALLKIRSDMDAIFRDSSLKGPLWEEISRKLAEMGYCRSAKKCKEKFENVHKYYKRTKDGKAGRQDGKSYRFFSQLESFCGNVNGPSSTSPNNVRKLVTGGGIGREQGLRGEPPHKRGSIGATGAGDFAAPAHRLDYSSGINFSSDSSDDDYDDVADNNNHPGNKKRKRKSSKKFMLFFDNLMKNVFDKQEKMQQRFLEALERREQDRMIREEAWKRQEMARMNREHELRAQERALAANRDAALVAFLQKVTGQTLQLPQITLPAQPVSSALDVHEENHQDKEVFDPNSKRWPKPEVMALIKLRIGMQPRFHEPRPKAPLWEEISAGMSRLGYSRNAKRCKEKWENINKYFKKARESNKKRPENAKTCPYYHQLEALYSEGLLGSSHNNNKQSGNNNAEDHPEELPEQPSDSNREDSAQAQGGDSASLAIVLPVGGSNTDDVATHFFSNSENGNGGDSRGLKKEAAMSQ